ncbi:MAG: MarR family transcriptional regulator [Saprospiraceae bacterium]|nr:MarR family transcriptional regulator [Saprospiraceae bacterium]
MRIEEAIKQREFSNPHHKAHVNILYTAAGLNQHTSAKLKPFGISVQQFNILRILRGRKNEASTVKLLTERMIDKMSNASRLVDKLVNKGLVERRTCSEDRRRVDVFITKKGMDVLHAASEAVELGIGDQLGQKISESEAIELNRILDKIHS